MGHLSSFQIQNSLNKNAFALISSKIRKTGIDYFLPIFLAVWYMLVFLMPQWSKQGYLGKQWIGFLPIQTRLQFLVFWTIPEIKLFVWPK